MLNYSSQLSTSDNCMDLDFGSSSSILMYCVFSDVEYIGTADAL